MIGIANGTQQPYSSKAEDRVFLNTLNLPIIYTNVSSYPWELQHQFASSFQLGKQFQQNAYRLADIPFNKRVHNVYNINHFPLDISDPELMQQPHLLLRSTAKQYNEQELQEILQHLGKAVHDLEKEVKQVGYNKTSWEPVDMLIESESDLVRDYL